MRTKELQTLWWDWLSTADGLLRTVHEQTVAITLRDLGRVQRLEVELQTMVIRLRALDDLAGTCLGKLAETLGTEATPRAVAQALEKAEGQGVQGIANRVTVTARTLDDVMGRNRTLLRSSTAIVDGAVVFLPKAPVPAGRTLRARVSYAA